MAVLPSHCVDEEELASLKSLVETQSEADDDMIGMEEDFRALLRKTAELEGAEAEAEAHSPSDELAWAESLEGAAREAAESLADEAEALRRGAAALALRPGEDAITVAAALRRRAALVDARRAEAEEVAAAAHRLQEKNLRSLAAREEEEAHLDDLSWLLGLVAGTVGPSLRGGASSCLAAPQELDELERACAATEERMAWLAGSLGRGAAAFAARPGCEEEALVGALRRQAEHADGARAAVVEPAAPVRRLRDRGRQDV
ncbi:unnamed protein product [Urochloa decumbens]|uniref:Uncharacterized protein n=1 Tax=Urochloa decumbens TaxID=240449 RepID=A0ABC8YB76_9POAL